MGGGGGGRGGGAAAAGGVAGGVWSIRAVEYQSSGWAVCVRGGDFGSDGWRCAVLCRAVLQLHPPCCCHPHLAFTCLPAGTTFLFRFAPPEEGGGGGGGSVRFHDLNTSLALRKRKRQQAGADGGPSDGDAFQQPERVVISLPGQAATGEQQEEEEELEEEQRQQQEGDGGGGGVLPAEAELGGRGLLQAGGSKGDQEMGDAAVAVVAEGQADGAVGLHGEQHQVQQADAGGGAANAALRDVFGSDDDDF